MNRHQRRAAAKSRPDQKSTAVVPDLGVPTGLPPQPVENIALDFGNAPLIDSSDERDDRGWEASATAVSRSNRGFFSVFLLKCFSRVLFSRWMLNRAKHFEIEQVIRSVAYDMGRLDIVDELTRLRATQELNIRFKP